MTHALGRAAHGLDGVFAVIARGEAWISRHPWAAFTVVGVASLLTETVTRGSPRGWDWVWISGMVAVSLGLPPAFRLRACAKRNIDRLADRGVLTGSSEDLLDRSERAGERLARYAGPAVAAVVLLVFLTRAIVPSQVEGPGFADTENNAVEIALACAAAFFVGRAAGRVVSLSMLGRRIELGPWELHAQPGHVDGAAGMKPIGDLYFRVAMVVAVPAVWLVVVLCLKTVAVVGAEGLAAIGEVVRPGRGWGPWYFMLLLAAIGLEIASFIAPLGYFHRVMSEQKRSFEQQADAQSKLLRPLVEQLPSLTDESARQAVESRIASVRAHNLRIEQMPTWPVDASIRRRFTIRNTLLLVPLVANSIGLAVDADTWSTLGDVFGG